MLRLTDIRLPVDHDKDALKGAVVSALGIEPDELLEISIFRQAHDARKKDAVSFVYTLDAKVSCEEAVLARPALPANISKSPYREFELSPRALPGLKQRPVIVGAGPCGYFAGLALARMGFKPLILERGKPVKQRAADTFGFWKKGGLDPESNVQFGEGGAGAFSDGKLTTRIKDRQFIARMVLNELVQAGAPPETAFAGKPHIGTYRLMGVVENLRKTILSLGGEIRFNARVEELVIRDGAVCGARLADGSLVQGSAIILAIGHSARDTFRMLHRLGVCLEPKPFSMGLRIEHPQALINRRQLGKSAGNPLLGAADYSLVHHASNGRTVYSFCMCPGGKVLAAASEENGLVTNGMSQHARDFVNANSALVVGVGPDDFPPGPLGGMEFQRHWEQKAYELGGGGYIAPAQLVGDFLEGRPSAGAGSVRPSYRPGVRFADLGNSLPLYIIEAVREAIPVFDRKIRGFAMPDAVLTGVETRTSSPVRIMRDETGQSVNVKGLYPAGEGAGYAGGILSSAVDGIKAAVKAAGMLNREGEQACPARSV